MKKKKIFTKFVLEMNAPSKLWASDASTYFNGEEKKSECCSSRNKYHTRLIVWFVIWGEKTGKFYIVKRLMKHDNQKNDVLGKIPNTQVVCRLSTADNFILM